MSAIHSHVEFRVHGLDCAEEVSLLRREVGAVSGVTGLTFDVLNAKMGVQYDSSRVDHGMIRAAVARTGMKCEAYREAKKDAPWWRRHGRLQLCLISAMALLGGAFTQATSFSEFVRSLLVHEHDGHIAPITMAFYAAAMISGMFFAAPKAWAALRRFHPEMNALVAVSILGAVVLREWLEGATLAFLFALAGLLESWSISRARNAVSSLLAVKPAEATVVHHHGEHRMPVEQVKVGEVVRVKPGERIPCDGEVTSGMSHVNQAVITGESIPVMKELGSTVFAGTMNGDGLVEVKVSKPPSDTLLSRMLRMLDGSHHRAHTEQFVERFARIYTPAIFLLAILVTAGAPLLMGWDWERAGYQGMVILLISCPCALVISTPVTVVAALASAARAGVLIKGGVHLEQAAKLKAFAFDKTGVLTQGQPEVQTFRTLDGMGEAEALRRLMALEQRSEHPVGHAIVRYALQQGIEPETVSEFRAVRGRGAEAVVGRERFWAGSHRFLHEKGLEREGICSQVEALEDEGHTAFLCGTGDHVWAMVALADPLRKEAAEAISGLRREGVERVLMLTGDNKPTAVAVGNQLGLEDVRAEMLPDEKAEAVKRLRSEYAHVAMVGDGINDAQALASATVGIALGRRSTDVALETADVVLMNEDLRNLGFLLRHARRAASVIRQNVVFAIGLKGMFLVMAFAGIATLWMAIAADMGATLLVTFNGLRLLRAKRCSAKEKA